MTGKIGQRQLAAIVFTDVAGFSSKVEADEERTLRRVREDLEFIEGISAGHNGKIIKTTGDGLLISFGSAIDAVSFATEAQRKIYEQNVNLRPSDRLEHRMGIHLGDIFLTDTDVMGDGVNIAARLQSEAEPGGICISQTVYDVVKNKLSINAVSLGPKELKNIREAIYAYRIVVDAESNLADTAAGETARAGRRRLVIYSAIAAAIAIVIAAALRPGARRPVPVATPPESPAAEAPPLQDLRSTTIGWVRPRLSGYNRENPLRLKVPGRPGVAGRGIRPAVISVWMEGDETLIDIQGDIRRRGLDQIDPKLLGAIARELARQDERAPVAPPEP